MTIDATSVSIVFGIAGLMVFAGVWLSLVIYRRVQRTNDVLLSQVDEYDKEFEKLFRECLNLNQFNCYRA